MGDSIIHFLSLFLYVTSFFIIFVLFYSIAVVPCIGMYNKALYVTSLGLRVSLKTANVTGFKTIGVSSTFLYQQSITSSQLTRA